VKQPSDVVVVVDKKIGWALEFFVANEQVWVNVTVRRNDRQIANLAVELKSDGRVGSGGN
jgi:hypothetical protein